MTGFSRAAALLLGWLALVPVPAAAQGHQVEVFWGEDASCTAWTRARDNPALRAYYEYWIRGFASGHNFALPSKQVRVGKLPGGEALYQYIDQYCKADPTQSFIGAAIGLVETLREPAAPPAKTPAKKPPTSKTPEPGKAPPAK